MLRQIGERVTFGRIVNVGYCGIILLKPYK